MMFNNILYLDESDNLFTRGIKTSLKKISGNLDCFFSADVFIQPIFKTKIQPKASRQMKKEKVRSLAAYISGNKYDLVFVNNVTCFPLSFIENLRNQFRGTPFISFNWSSVNKKNFMPFVEHFDKTYSFDREDCKKYNLLYKPLFYLADFEGIGIGTKKRFDLSYLGSAFSPGKLKFFNDLFTSDKLSGLKEYIYLSGRSRKSHIKAFLKYPALRNHLYRHWLSENEVLNLYSCSGAMIDYPMSIQTGLNIRTFETLAAGLDLYTTNALVADEPFYNADRIYVIKEDFSDFEFVKKDEASVDMNWQNEFRKYHIDNWVRSVVSME
jgi:hypothetical protein